MKALQTIDDVYPEIEKLILLLSTNHSRFASVIDHRMHQVAWTTKHELIAELHIVLENIVREKGEQISEEIMKQILKTQEIIKKHL